MANEFRTIDAHSAEYFGDTRDHWWNVDFLALMAKRLAFENVNNVLDVGCGVGHWGQLLLNVLPRNTHLIGLDRDSLWVEKATGRARERGLSERTEYRVAVAENLPFADDHFDMVTCQTVLIHTRDPGCALDEMIRVTRPGGLILVAEPNNLVSALISDSVRQHETVEETLDRVRLQLICERGKASLGEGNNSVGDLIPGLFAARGLREISVHIADKTSQMLPPYDSDEQRASIEEQSDLAERDFWIWSREDHQRYFEAGGGEASAFEKLWSNVIHNNRLAKAALASRTYAGIGVGIIYLVAGRKPLANVDRS